PILPDIPQSAERRVTPSRHFPEDIIQRRNSLENAPVMQVGGQERDHVKVMLVADHRDLSWESGHENRIAGSRRSVNIHAVRAGGLMEEETCRGEGGHGAAFAVTGDIEPGLR